MIYFTASSGDGGYVPGALTATREQFFDVPEGEVLFAARQTPAQAPVQAPVQADVAAGGIQIGLSSGETPYYRLSGEAVGLGMRKVWALQPGWALDSSAALEMGRAEYRLPVGLGIFTDPITMGFDYRRAVVEAGLSHVPGRAGRMRYSGGVGVEVTDVATVVRSDLLDVRNRTVLHGTFGYLRVTARVAPGLALFGQVRAYARVGGAASGGLVIGY